MKFKNLFSGLSVGKSARTAILLVVVAAVTLEATSLFQGIFARRTIQDELSVRAGMGA